MEDLNWLQYVGNPYSVIAVIAAIIGGGFRSALRSVKKPDQKLLVAMYTMFLLAAVSLGLSVVAIVFLLSGIGATDVVSKSTVTAPTLVQKAHAEGVVEGHQDLAEDVDYGWVWAGSISWTGTFEAETVRSPHMPKQRQILVTKKQVHLRDSAPQFQWFLLRYVPGEDLHILSKNTRLRVVDVETYGWNVWMRVRVVK